MGRVGGQEESRHWTTSQESISSTVDRSVSAGPLGFVPSSGLWTGESIARTAQHSMQQYPNGLSVFCGKTQTNSPLKLIHDLDHIILVQDLDQIRCHQLDEASWRNNPPFLFYVIGLDCTMYFF